MTTEHHNENNFTITPEMIRTKPIFPPREDDKPLDSEKIENDIIKHCETNPSHTWYGHSHNKPPSTTKVIFLCEISLSNNNKSPCPCCKHNTTPKFNAAIVIYFIEEHAIRIIGKDCFKKLYPDLYHSAYTSFKKRKDEKYEQNIIIINLPILSLHIEKLKKAQKVAIALEVAHRELHSRLNICQINLRTVSKDGILDLKYRKKITKVDSDGEAELEYETLSEFHGRLIAYDLLNPKLSDIYSKISESIKKLEQIKKSSSIINMSELSEAQLSKIAIDIKSAINAYNSSIKLLIELRSFFDSANITKITNYGRSRYNNNPFEFFILGDIIYINRLKSEHSFKLSENLRIYLPEIDLMAQYSIAA